ncbi:MAG: polysaccharide biosynthesis tyrosine autokinase [Lachnospiraceae bacterium]
MDKKEEPNLIDITSLLEDFMKTVKKFWISLIVCILVAAAGFYLYVRVHYQPEYQSQATFSVNTEGSAVVSSGTSGSEQVKESLPYILQSDVMKDMVMEDLDLSTFPARIELESKESANFYVLKVTSDDAGMAYSILQSILKKCPEASVYVLGKIQIEVLDDSGIAARSWNYLDKRMSLLKGAIAGAFLWLIFALFYTLTNHTIQREEDFKKYLSVTCIAVIPKIVFKKRRKEFDKHIHIYNDKVGYGFMEAMRSIRTRVMREMNRIDGRVIMVTSSVPGEGKSTLAANLALSLAERGQKVALVDMDLRNPSIGKVLGMEDRKKAGMSELLKGRCALEEAVQSLEEWGLDVIFGGEPQSDPVKLLSAGGLSLVIDRLEECYDYVVMDTPPAAMLSDASSVAACADCALYVVKQDYARIERIAEGMDMLTISRLPIIGAILNGVERTLGGYGSYGGYRYGRYSHYGVYGERVKEGEENAEYVDVGEQQEKE